MNTTAKYLYERKEIDPLTFRDVGTVGLDLEVVNNEMNSFIISKYRLNRSGFLHSCQRKELGWTAFPPLNGAIKINDIEKVKKLDFTEIFEYRDEKLKCSKLINDESQELKSQVNYKFENSNLKEINKTYFRAESVSRGKQIFIYNCNNMIIAIKEIIEVNEQSKIVKETNFNFDKIGLVSEKFIKHSTTIGKSVISYTSKEEFKYNTYQQLEESTKTGYFDNQKMMAEMKFRYLTSECDLLTEIKIKEEHNISSIKKYLYDDERRLQCIKTRNSSNESKTIYKRK